MTMKDLFDFITDPNITEKNMEACLDKLSERAATRQDDLTQEEQVSEEVFKSAYIPQTLNEVPCDILLYYIFSKNYVHSDSPSLRIFTALSFQPHLLLT